MNKYLKYWLCLCCMFIFTACISEDDDTEIGNTELQIGDRIPDFQVTMNDGQIVSTEKLRGKCAVIVFFHTQCPDCQQEFPVLQRLYEESPLPIEMVCISRKEPQESIATYWTKHGLTLPYAAQETADIYHQFAKSIIPRVYVSDKDLVIRAVFTDHPIATYEDLSKAVELASNSSFH